MYSGYLCKFDFDETQNIHKNAHEHFTLEFI